MGEQSRIELKQGRSTTAAKQRKGQQQNRQKHGEEQQGTNTEKNRPHMALLALAGACRCKKRYLSKNQYREKTGKENQKA